MSEPIRTVDVLRLGAMPPVDATDRVAVEAPLEVRLAGEPFAVIMRTPGSDRELGAGFLLSEGVITSAEDLVRIEPGAAPDVLDVTLSPARALALPAWLGARRQVAMTAACGLCGRQSLESLDIDVVPLAAEWTVPAQVVAGLPDALRQAQHAFAETGGLHAAGLFDCAGRLEASAEDVGRHNAVDKLIGRMLLGRRLPLSRSLLVVSGRTSFEIVQKAYLGGIGLVAAVSAPSSLAVDLADRAGMTLLGFVRDGRANVYTHPSRVEPAAIA